MAIKVEWIKDEQESLYQWWERLTPKERQGFRQTLQQEVWQRLDALFGRSK